MWTTLGWASTTLIIYNSDLHAVAGVDHIGLGGDYLGIYNSDLLAGSWFGPHLAGR